MKISQFAIGQTFWTGSRKWRCTDVCTHFIAAIELNQCADPRTHIGPPYEAVELAFDESKIEACTQVAEPDDQRSWEARKEEFPCPYSKSKEDPPSEEECLFVLKAWPEPEGMNFEDFSIGDLFLRGVHIMRCVDIGSRVIIGFDLCHAGENWRWFQGEPFSMETVEDEDAIPACTPLYPINYELNDWLRTKGKGGFRSKVKALLDAAMQEDS